MVFLGFGILGWFLSSPINGIHVLYTAYCRDFPRCGVHWDRGTSLPIPSVLGEKLEGWDPSGLASCERNHLHGLELPWSRSAIWGSSTEVQEFSPLKSYRNPIGMPPFFRGRAVKLQGCSLLISPVRKVEIARFIWAVFFFWMILLREGTPWLQYHTVRFSRS